MKQKKWFRSLVLAILLLCLSVVPVLALTGTVTTAGSRLRVRTGPGKNHSLIYRNGQLVQLDRGTEVSVLGTYPSDTADADNPVWYHIQAEFAGELVSGYVSASYITVEAEPERPPVSGGDVDIYAVPEPYRPYLKPIMEKHPNWKFTFFDTGLDWNDVMDNECYRGKAFRNVVSKNSPVSYRYQTSSGAYLKSPEGWYQASDAVVAYYMDPRNLMTEARIFQFEYQGFNAAMQTVSGVESIIQGSFMANTTITADNGEQVTYAQAIYEAGRQASVSPYFLASKILQEVGRGGSGSSSGNYIAKDGTDMRGYYNFYNIQATSATSDPIKQGLQWAAQSGSYGRPWTSPYKSIIGGAQWIAKGYIAVGQNSIYLQKFDVDNSDGKLYYHQYMTNVAGAVGESNIAFKGYVNSGMLENDFVFAIPLFRNLPAERCRLPGDTSVDPDPIPDPLPEPEPEPEPEPLPGAGDVNGNGQIDAVDARMILQSVSGLRTLTAEEIEKADINADGAVNAVDARWILQIVAGLR